MTTPVRERPKEAEVSLVHPVAALAFPQAGDLTSLAVDVPVVAAELRLVKLDEMFRCDQSCSAVLARWNGMWQLISRPTFDRVLTGPFGYALATGRTLASLLPCDTLVVPAGTTLGDAADKVLARTGSARFDDLVLDHGDRAQVVSVPMLFAALAAAFQRAAVTDPLTGLPNRMAVSSMIAASDDDALVDMAALYVDLDRFKDVNDSYGHRVGDDVLVQFAERLRDCVRPDDVVARLGGDEFFVALRGVTPERAAAVGERILMSAAAPFLVDDLIITIGASVGIAMAHDATGERHLSTAEVLLQHADAAMYKAKASGRGRMAGLARASGCN